MIEVRKSGILQIIPLILNMLFCPFVYGRVIYVDDDTQADFDNIQAGIDSVDDGDTVLVAPGEYVITEPITFRGKTITVKSEAGQDDTTIRMGTPADTNRGSVVVFENGETAASVLDGFTITEGRGSWVTSVSASAGGGIFFDASSGTVSNCAIVRNRAEYGGGILCAYLCSPRIIDCIIAENSAAASGGGVFAWLESSLILTNCIVRGNLAIDGGGGLQCWENSSVTMTYCTIAENSADVSGGVFGGENSFITMSHCVIISNTAYKGSGGMETWHQSSADVSNCVIAWNTALGLGGGGVNCSFQGSATITNSIIWGNTAPKGREIWVRGAGTLNISYSNVAGGQAEATIEGGTIHWGDGNIDIDPCFADPNNEDYHLKSQAGRWNPVSETWIVDDVTSPCIDTGDPNSDWSAELWPHGTRANMGAYGGTFQASRSLSDVGNIADLNRDGIIDSTDMSIMVDYWLTDEQAYDIAPPPFGDGIVDVQDLIILAEHLFDEPAQRPQVTTVVIVRHAERSNGTLTEVGEKRAETLARLLSKAGVSAIFSTNYTRTIETANNTAERLGIPIQFYTSIEGVADLIKSEYTGKVVLVVGHSNTVTQTVEALGVSSVPQFDGRYDNLYIVTIGPDDIALLTHLRFDILPDL